MSVKTYSSYFQGQTLRIFREYWSVFRTILRNEVSVLSFLSTSLLLIAAGATLIKLFDNEWVQFLGWSFVAIGAWISIGVSKKK